MTGNTCVRCGRPMADQAYADAHCAAKAAEQLRTIADMTPAARDVARGMSRRSGGGGASGKPESRLPFDLGATSKLDAVQGSLTTWARHIAEERQGATWVWTEEPIVEASLWLAGQIEWLRHRREVDEFLSDVGRCAGVVAGIARGPAAQRYLGPCGLELEAGTPTCPALCTCRSGSPGSTLSACEACACLTGCHGARPCEGDVYARDGARVGRCRTCGAEVATGERQAWLDGEVRSHAFRAAHIAEAYGVNVKTIRTWAARGALKSYYRTEGGIVADWADPAEGEDRVRLHYVGDVLDLAAADAARREGERAKRARRAADRAADDERLKA